MLVSNRIINTNNHSGTVIAKKKGTNLSVAINALHLPNDDIWNAMFTSQGSHILDLRFDHGLVLVHCIGWTAIPVRAEAVECVLATGQVKEFRHPKTALIDARLSLQGDTASAACTLLVAVAGAGSANLCSFRIFKIVDGALG